MNVTAQIQFIYFFRNQSDIRLTNSNSACHRTLEHEALRFVCYAHAHRVSRIWVFLNTTTGEIGIDEIKKKLNSLMIKKIYKKIHEN